MAKERGYLWTDAEVTALIAIWGEEEIQRQLDGATRNIKVYEKLAARLSSLEDCSDRTAVQCREKIKKLKGDYRKAKDNNNRSGRGRTICAFFNQLDAILGCRPGSAPDTVVGSMRSMGDEASVHCGDERRDESSEPTATDEGEENVDHVLRTPGKCNIFPYVTVLYIYIIYIVIETFKLTLCRCVRMPLPECAGASYSQ